MQRPDARPSGKKDCYEEPIGWVARLGTKGVKTGCKGRKAENEECKGHKSWVQRVQWLGVKGTKFGYEWGAISAHRVKGVKKSKKWTIGEVHKN